MNLYNLPVNKFVAGFIGSPAMNFVDGKIIQEEGLKFIDNEGLLKLNINEEHKSSLEKYINKPIIMGIRPEDIHEFDIAKVDADQKFTARIEVVEPMGNELFIYFNIDEVQMVGRLPSYINAEMGKPLDLTFDINKLHFFDIETELAIRQNKSSG